MSATTAERLKHAEFWAEYERQRDPLWAEYERQRALVDKPGRDALWAAFNARRDDLLAEYERKCAAVPQAVSP